MSTEPTEVVPATPVRPNSLQRLFGVLFAPDSTMKSIAERPDWVVPLLLILIMLTVCSALSTPHLDMETLLREQWAEQGMSEERIESTLERMEKFQNIVAPISTFIMMGVGLAAVAGLFFGAFKAFGGAGRYVQALAITIYGSMPFVLKNILATALVMPRGKISPEEMANLVKSNPAFLTDMQDSPMLFSILSSIDVFTIWTLFLFVVGLAYMSRFSRARAAAVVISIWLLFVLGKAGIAAAMA